MQKVLRLELTMLWGKSAYLLLLTMLILGQSVWQGGHGKVPWELICANLNKWIPSNRRPFSAALDDPSNLRLSAVVTWLEYFHMCQSGAIPPEQQSSTPKSLPVQTPSIRASARSRRAGLSISLSKTRSSGSLNSRTQSRDAMLLVAWIIPTPASSTASPSSPSQLDMCPQLPISKPTTSGKATKYYRRV
jgi:hypothetical protein